MSDIDGDIYNRAWERGREQGRREAADEIGRLRAAVNSHYWQEIGKGLDKLDLKGDLLKDEIKQLRDELEIWKDRYEAACQAHEATIKAWDEERQA